MNWENISKAVTEHMPFIEESCLSVGEKTPSCKPHPFIVFNTFLACRHMDFTGISNIVISLPFRDQIAKWVSIFSVLKIIKDDFNSVSSSVVKYVPGQKFSLNGAIVEFVDQTAGAQGTVDVKVRYLNEDKKNPGFVTWTIPNTNTNTFQPIDQTAELSRHSRVEKALTDMEENKSVLNELLKIDYKENVGRVHRNVILVSGQGETYEFINENYLNGAPIIETIPIGKLDNNGKSGSYRNADKRKPILIVSSTLSGAYEFASNNADNFGVIIDGLDRSTGNLQFLDDLIGTGKKIIIFSTNEDYRDAYKYLNDRGFLFWSWDKKLTSESFSDLPSTNYQKDFSLKLNNYCHLNTSLEKCTNKVIEEIINSLASIPKLEDEELEGVRKFRYRFVSQVNWITRLGILPDVSVLKNYQKNIDALVSDFNEIQHSMDVGSGVKIRSAINILKNLNESVYSELGGKYCQIKKWLEKEITSGNSKINYICSDSESAESAKNFWVGIFGEKCLLIINFVSFDSLPDPKDTSRTVFIFPGWLGKTKMNAVFDKNITGEMVFFLYHTEEIWLFYFLKNLNKSNFTNVDLALFKDIIGDRVFTEVSPTLTEQKPVAEDYTTELDDMVEDEYKILLHSFLPQQTAINSPVPSKLVLFEDESYIYATANHKFIVVTEFVNQLPSPELSLHTADALRNGDWILTRHSNRDLLREIAEQEMIKQGGENTLRLSKIWKRCLLEEFNRQFQNMTRLVNVLREAGCKKQQNTIKLWMDEDQIGPRDDDDLLAIAIASGSQELENNLAETRRAIQIVRSFHIQAGDLLSAKIRNHLPELIEKISAVKKNDLKINFNMDNVGEVTLYRIIAIHDKYTDVDEMSVNKILKNDDESNDSSLLVFRS